MSEQPLRVPPAEQPQKTVDESLEKLEESTLDKQARSASFRAEVAHDRHLVTLNKRIDVLQDKLDKREYDLHWSLPRVAELEQAEKTTRIATVVETIGAGGGAILLSIASFADTDPWKFGLLGAGIAIASLALFGKALFTLFGWPKSPQ